MTADERTRLDAEHASIALWVGTMDHAETALVSAVVGEILRRRHEERIEHGLAELRDSSPQLARPALEFDLSEEAP